MATFAHGVKVEFSSMALRAPHSVHPVCVPTTWTTHTLTRGSTLASPLSRFHLLESCLCAFAYASFPSEDAVLSFYPNLAQIPLVLDAPCTSSTQEAFPWIFPSTVLWVTHVLFYCKLPQVTTWFSARARSTLHECLQSRSWFSGI